MPPLDQNSWQYISQHGSTADTLDYLANKNIHRQDLELIAWRCKDKNFFIQTTAILRKRQIYHPTIWAFATIHNDVRALQEFLPQLKVLTDSVHNSLWLDTLTVSPVDLRQYEHLEYLPLVNARVHNLGKRAEILNASIYQQYHKLLNQLLRKPRDKWQAEDYLSLCYYLALQDRYTAGSATDLPLNLAESCFSKVARDKLLSPLCYDYFASFFALRQGDLATAKKWSSPYADYPVKLWQQRFNQVLQQITEIETADRVTRNTTELKADPSDRQEKLEALAQVEPQLSLQQNGRDITLHYRNLREVRVNWYCMDIELLFSRQPFMKTDKNVFALVMPNLSQTLKLPESDSNNLIITVPEQYKNINLALEVEAEGLSDLVILTSNAMHCQVMQQSGQLRISQQGSDQALSGVYVKVFARQNKDQITFIKDGYTDLRGRFDYATLSTDEVEKANALAILAIHPEYGAIIVETTPPAGSRR